jgi:transposase
MCGMRPEGSAAELERRRRRAVELLRQGKKVREVARMVGASPGSVTVWRQAVERQGTAGLDAKPHPGRPPDLSESQVRELLGLLGQGAVAHGYVNRQWTLKRVAKLIEDRFGVRYDPSGVWHLLRRGGWSCQMPEHRARERDEAAVRRFRKRTWPRLKKSPRPPASRSC